MNRIIFLVLLTLPGLLPAQNIIRPGAFDEISVTGNIEVRLVPGDEESVRLEVRNIPEDKVTVSVSGRKLRLKVLESLLYKDEEISAVVTYRTLNAVRGEAGAVVRGDQVLEAGDLLVRAGTGARVELDVRVENIESIAGEGGILTLRGTTDRQEASASTGGQYHAFDLESRHTEVRANTGGRAEVVAREYLEASANTGGSVVYKGDPESSSLKTVLSGSVEKF